MVYGPAIAKLVLFGGTGSGNVQLSDTWTYDGSNWTKQAPSTSPTSGLMDYDAAVGKIVLVGGMTGNETWTYDGADWTHLSATVGPPDADGDSPGGPMAYDPATGEMILLLGSGAMFVYDGNTWTFELIGKQPGGESGGSMAYDSSSGQMVAFGGALSVFRDAPGGGYWTTQYSDSTYRYDGKDWILQPMVTSPTPRTGAAMAYDPALGTLVIFGGARGSTVLADKWVYRIVPAGYWLAAADGGVFSFSVPFCGSAAAGVTLNRPVVGMGAAPDGNGYWLVASDGAVFGFGPGAGLKAPWATGPSTSPSSVWAPIRSPGATGWSPPTAGSSASEPRFSDPPAASG